MSVIRHFPIFLFFASIPVSLETQELPRMGGLSLVPGDFLRVLVWREEDLSGEFQVDQNGNLVLPLLGEVSVEERGWDEVRDWLLQEYGKELRNPSIELTPLRSVYVLGEVNLPGRYNIDPTNDNLAGAVSLAGGVTLNGDMRNMRIVRDGGVILEVGSALVDDIEVACLVESYVVGGLPSELFRKFRPIMMNLVAMLAFPDYEFFGVAFFSCKDGWNGQTRRG